MFLTIHPENPEIRKIEKVVNCLREGGIIIYPTDTIYGLGCDINNPKALARICQLKGLDPKKASLAFICRDLSHLSDYTINSSKAVYKVLNRNLPGPFTFILKANNEVPKLLKNKKKTVGIRIPNNKIALTIVEELGNPILTTSLHHKDEFIQYPTDPSEMFDEYQKEVDIVIDGGYGKHTPSTVVDCTTGEIEILRQGAGELEY